MHHPHLSSGARTAPPPVPAAAPRLSGMLDAYRVLTDARQEVTLRNGCAWHLYRVERHGTLQRDLRAVQPHPAPAGAPVRVIDLRALVPSLSHELPTAAARDVPGLITYSLRQHYPDGAALGAALAVVALAEGAVGTVQRLTACPFCGASREPRQ